MTRYSKPLRLTPLLLFLLLVLVACGGSAPPANPNDAPVSSDDTPVAEPPAPEGEMTIGEMQVESLDILTLESFPVQIQVIAQGMLADGCTTVGEITQRREGNTFFVTVATQRPTEAMCTMALTPGQAIIPLEVVGLKAGTYTVTVNGVSDTFELLTDNIAP
ncbi:MAG: hypothetical protein H0T73_19055 [Ardenticatenales bacterium]|nr:hypothetical protein [Ardenticatenales bacterium]